MSRLLAVSHLPSSRALRQELWRRKDGLSDFGDIDDLPALVRIAAAQEPRMRRLFLDVVSTVRSRVNMSQLIRAFQSGDYGVVQTEVNRVVMVLREELGTQFANEFRDGFLKGARHAVNELQAAGIGLSFDLVNDRAVVFADTFTRTFAGGISDAARTAIQEEVTLGMQGQRTPQQIARNIRDVIGLNNRDAAFLHRFEQRLVEEEGVTAAERAERVREMNTSLIHRRAKVIARTEVIRGHNMGQLGAWNEAVEEGLLNPADVMQQWTVTRDDRLDIIHCEPLDRAKAPLNGTTWKKQGRVIKEGLIGPPVHPNCRCAVVLAFN